MSREENYLWFKKWVLKENHPCIMAQTVFRMDHVDYHEYDSFGTNGSVTQMLTDLEDYIERYDFSSNEFLTFIAAFPNENRQLTEAEFEKKLWSQLQHLHNGDDKEWDEKVNSDPENEKFSFSLKGKAFYIVGLHPNSSRLARRTPFPAIAFNLHSQFEKLREMKKFKLVRNRIRKRDKQLQGSVNPVLEDFGNSSEARQYSGKQVSESWKCPFHHK